MPDAVVKFRSVIGIGGYGPEFTYARIKGISQTVADKNLDRIGQAIGKILGKSQLSRVCSLLFFGTDAHNFCNYGDRFVHEHPLRLVSVKEDS